MPDLPRAGLEARPLVPAASQANQPSGKAADARSTPNEEWISFGVPPRNSGLAEYRWASPRNRPLARENGDVNPESANGRKTAAPA